MCFLAALGRRFHDETLPARVNAFLIYMVVFVFVFPVVVFVAVQLRTEGVISALLISVTIITAMLLACYAYIRLLLAAQKLVRIALGLEAVPAPPPPEPKIEFPPPTVKRAWVAPTGTVVPPALPSSNPPRPKPPSSS